MSKRARLHDRHSGNVGSEQVGMALEQQLRAYSCSTSTGCVQWEDLPVATHLLQGGHTS